MLGELFKIAKDQIGVPILRRVASNAATAATVAGVSQGDVETLTAAAIIVVGLLVDLVMTRLNASKQRDQWGKN